MVIKDLQTEKYKVNSDTPYGKLNESQKAIMNKFLNKVTEVKPNEKYNDDEHLILVANEDNYCFDEYKRIYPIGFSEDSSTIQIINTGVGENSIGYGNIARAVYHCYDKMSIDTFAIEYYTGDTIMKKCIYKIPSHAFSTKEQLVKFFLDITGNETLARNLELVDCFIVMRVGNTVQYMNKAWETILDQPSSGSFIHDCKDIIYKAYEHEDSKRK